MILFLCLFIFFLIVFSASKRIGAPVKRCLSRSCGHNIGGNCVLKQIDIYDNGVIGLCLWHTATMSERLLEPMTKGKEIGKIDGKIAIIEEIQKKLFEDKDAEAIKSPEEFAKWMQRHLKPDQKS